MLVYAMEGQRMAVQPAGPIIDGLGITVDLAPGDLIASAMLLAKVVTGDGQVTLLIAESESMSWLDQLGLVAAAGDVIRSDGFEQHDDD